jgi:hypothetical protein
MRQFPFVSMARARRGASSWVGAGCACLTAVSLVVGCASPSLMPPMQAAAVRQRDRALASHAAAIQDAIRQSGKAGALAFLDPADGRLVILPGDSPADAWAHQQLETGARVSAPEVLTFVHRADVPRAPDTVSRPALERELTTRASAAAFEAELRETHRRIDERLAALQGEISESIAATKKETDASVAAARADMQKALKSASEDIESVRKFMLQTAQLGWLNNELNMENAAGIKKLATASQELSATAARLQSSMTQVSEHLGAQLKELANRLDALQGKVTSLK